MPAQSRTPLRTCIVTRKQGEPGDMLRFVAGPDGRVVPDIKRRLPGRGVWVGLDRALVAQAAQRRLFARSLGEAAAVEDDLAGKVDDLLARDALQALSLVNKTGAARIGFDKAETALRSGEAAALLAASDAGADGARKLAAAARGLGVAVLEPATFAAAELGAAFGRDHAVHIALCRGGATDMALEAIDRLGRYRAGGDTR